MNLMRALLAASLIAAACAFAPQSAFAAPAAKSTPDLSGQWRLNHARSDDPQKKIEEATSRMPMGGPPGGMGGMGGGMPPGGMGGGMPPGGMGGRPPGGMGGGPPGGSDDPMDAPGMKHVMDTLELFTLEQRADTLTFVDRGICVRQIVVNGGHKLSARGQGGVDQASGRWKQSRLVAETKGPRGEKIREVWELIDEGRSLRSTTTIDLPGPMGSIEISRLYDRAIPQPAE